MLKGQSIVSIYIYIVDLSTACGKLRLSTISQAARKFTINAGKSNLSNDENDAFFRCVTYVQISMPEKRTDMQSTQNTL